MPHFIRALFLVFSAFVLAACSSTPSTDSKSLRLYVLDCGAIDSMDVSMFQGKGIGKGEHKKLVDSCYLIVHPNGTLLWDAGLPDSLVSKPNGQPVWDGAFVLHVNKTLAAQLKEIGYNPESIRYVGISHMHLDHIGNVDLVPRATLLIQKEEYDAAFGSEPNKYGFDPTGYPTLRANPVKKLEGDYDVFGDGSVVIKRLLGHTPGHQGLYIKLPKTGNILLSGDLVHFTDNWTHKRVPDFNFDKAQSAKSLNDVEKFLKTNNATLWIQHDLEQNAAIKHAPAYYE